MRILKFKKPYTGRAGSSQVSRLNSRLRNVHAFCSICLFAVATARNNFLLLDRSWFNSPLEKADPVEVVDVPDNGGIDILQVAFSVRFKKALGRFSSSARPYSGDGREAGKTTRYEDDTIMTHSQGEDGEVVSASYTVVDQGTTTNKR